MTDDGSAIPVHTSGCGNVAILGGETTPTVRLALDAVRLPTRDLAELVTVTAREAADAARAEQTLDREGYGSAAEALEGLKQLREEIRESGPAAAIERKRIELGALQPDLPPGDPRARAGIVPNASEFPTSMLDMAIGVLERFGNQPGGVSAELGAHGAIGTATSPEGHVTVKATGEYPIAQLLLGNNARALGPEALAEEITETAARAADDLKERQRAQIDALGLPLSMDQVDGLPEETKAYGRKTLGQAAYLRQQHDEAIRRLRQQ